MRRGEIRWCRFAPPDKERPVLILARNDVIGALHEVIVVPSTRTIRQLASEVVLDVGDGMPTQSAFIFDRVSAVRKERIGALVTTLHDERWPEVQRALLYACGFPNHAH